MLGCLHICKRWLQENWFSAAKNSFHQIGIKTNDFFWTCSKRSQVKDMQWVGAYAAERGRIGLKNPKIDAGSLFNVFKRDSAGSLQERKQTN